MTSPRDRLGILCETKNKECQAEITCLDNLLDQYSANPDLVIPAQMLARAASVKEDFEVRTRHRCYVVGYLT